MHCKGIMIGIVWLVSAAAFAQQHAVPGDEWAAMQATVDEGARQAQRWQYLWGTGYAAAATFYAVEADRASDADDRYDARVSAVKSLLGLADVLLFPQPHRRAQREFAELRATGDVAAARARIANLAAEEQYRRRLGARTGPLLVNLAGGLLIAFDDDRAGDGALNFATGMLVSELRIRTQSTAASRYQAAPSFTLRAGGARLPVQYRWWLTPQMASVQLRF